MDIPRKKAQKIADKLNFLQQNQLDNPFLLESAASLKKNYERVQKGKEDLEAKLKAAKHLREKISHLKSGKDFLQQKNISKLIRDLAIQRSVIHNSAIAESEIKKHKDIIAEIQSSGKVVSPAAKIMIGNTIDAMQTSITNASKVQQEILKAKTESGYRSEARIEELQKKLDGVRNILEKLKPFNPGEVHFYKCYGRRNSDDIIHKTI